MFDNVFMDECTVQLDLHSRLCIRKQRQPHALKQRPKHPAKVHIWGGISVRGATRIVIFTGNMNTIRYNYVRNYVRNYVIIRTYTINKHLVVQLARPVT